MKLEPIEKPKGLMMRIAYFRTAKAIAWVKANYTKPLRMEELAQIAGMGLSTLHHHFRALTAMSPLQYQKQLRLQPARGRMLADGLDAASLASAPMLRW
jgi:AraC-like DNA-binding protein